MNKILIATTNPAKFGEYQTLLSKYPLETMRLQDLKIDGGPIESGTSFEENAIIKARYYFNLTNLPSLVDDGGLEIEALNNEPGVYSRRWLGREMQDDELIDEVFKRMKDVPPDKRRCKLALVLALATPFGIVISDGSVEGIIAEKPSHTRIPGYPYRSLMYFPAYGKYYSELSDQENEILNHRKAAVEKIHDIFLELCKW